MKKIITLLFLITLFQIQGQTLINENFDNTPLYGIPANWEASGEDLGWGFEPTVFASSEVACTNIGMLANLYDDNISAFLTSPQITLPSTNNIVGSFGLKIVDYGWFPPYTPTTGDWGSLNLQYSTNNGVTWTSLQITNSTNFTTTENCQTVNFNVPSTALVGATSIKFKFDLNWTAGDFYVAIDNFIAQIIPQVTTLPCVTTPTATYNIACNNGTAVLNWSPVANAVAYKVYVGTTAGNYNVHNAVLTTNTSFNLSNLTSGTPYFWKIVPTTTVVDAQNCTENTFTTATINCLCTPTYNEAYGSFYEDYISNITTTGATTNLNNTSTFDTNGYTAYNSLPFSTTTGQSISFSVTYEYLSYSFITGWIDWNNNNIFEETERFLPVTEISATNPTTFSYTVPATATAGTYTLRIRSRYDTDETFTIDPCANYNYGETEDYKITVTIAANPCAGTLAPTGNATQTLNAGQTLANLTVTGTNLLWYADAALTTLLPNTTVAVTGTTYYVTQTVGTCVSPALAITVTIAADPCAGTLAPTGNATQTLNTGQTLADLVVTGTNIKWYADAALTIELPNTTVAVDGTTYYAIQTIGTCVSPALAVTVTITASTNDLDLAELKLYPNPSTNLVNITYKEDVSVVTIYDLTGKLIKTEFPKSEAFSIDISNLSSGIYFIKVETANKKQATLKFVKK